MEKRKILICAAIQNEISPIRETLSDRDLDYLITGIGKEKTVMALDQYLMNERPTCIINAGTCGSLKNRFNIGTIVYPESYTVLEKSGKKMIKSDYQKYLENKLTGHLLTSLKPITTTMEKDHAIKQTNTDIVDMESYWIADLCQRETIDFFSVKVITDFAQDFSINDFKREMNKQAKKLVIPVNQFLRTNYGGE